MKNFLIFVWIGYILTIISAVIAIIIKITGIRIFGASSDTYLLGCILCLLFIISLSLVQMALVK